MLSSLGYQKVRTSVTQYLAELTILSQTKVCWILIFFLKSWLRRGKQMALRLKMII